MRKEFFIFFPYFNMLYLEGAVTATGKYNINLERLIYRKKQTRQIGDNATFLLIILQFRRYFLVSGYIKSKKGVYILEKGQKT